MIVTTTLQAHQLHATTRLSNDISPLSLRTAFSQFPSGVSALDDYTEDGTPQSIVASSFTVGVSLAPPLVSVEAQTTSSTWPVLREIQRIGISILAEGQGTIARKT